MSKKVIALLAMSVLVLSSCGEGNTKEPTALTPATTSATQAAKEESTKPDTPTEPQKLIDKKSSTEHQPSEKEASVSNETDAEINSMDQSSQNSSANLSDSSSSKAAADNTSSNSQSSNSGNPQSSKPQQSSSKSEQVEETIPEFSREANELPFVPAE